MLNTELVERHLRASILGEPMPGFRDDEMGQLIGALSNLSQPDMARLGCMTALALLDRIRSSMEAERQIAMARSTGSTDH